MRPVAARAIVRVAPLVVADGWSVRSVMKITHQSHQHNIPAHGPNARWFPRIPLYRIMVLSRRHAIRSCFTPRPRSPRACVLDFVQDFMLVDFTLFLQPTC